MTGTELKKKMKKTKMKIKGLRRLQKNSAHRLYSLLSNSHDEKEIMKRVNLFYEEYDHLEKRIIKTMKEEV